MVAGHAGWRILNVLSSFAGPVRSLPSILYENSITQKSSQLSIT